jgi:1,2-phenylacetyl-CoA epoxidase catalytic subunit
LSTQTSKALQSRIEKLELKKLEFLVCLSETHDCEQAAKKADTSFSLVKYKWLKNDSNFAEKFDDIMRDHVSTLNLTSCACGMKFDNYRGLSKHGRNCTKFTIPEEKKTLDTKKQLTSWSRQLNDTGEYECTCGKTFHDSRSLQNHTRFCESFVGIERVQASRLLIHSTEARRKMSLYASSQTISPGFKTKWYEVSNLKGESFKLQGTWEREVAHRLNEMGVHWSRGKMLTYDGYHHYTPDFDLGDNTFVEVKGWWKPTESIKMKAVLSSHVDKKILVIDDRNYYAFAIEKSLCIEKLPTLTFHFFDEIC